MTTLRRLERWPSFQTIRRRRGAVQLAARLPAGVCLHDYWYPGEACLGGFVEAYAATYETAKRMKVCWPPDMVGVKGCYFWVLPEHMDEIRRRLAAYLTHPGIIEFFPNTPGAPPTAVRIAHFERVRRRVMIATPDLASDPFAGFPLAPQFDSYDDQWRRQLKELAELHTTLQVSR